MFAFTGVIASELVVRNCDRMLRDLEAVSIAKTRLPAPAVDGVCAVRSSGYFSVAGLWVWAQHNFYITGSEEPGQGRAVQQCVFVEHSRQAALEADIAQLSDAMHKAFVTAVADT